MNLIPVMSKWQAKLIHRTVSPSVHGVLASVNSTPTPKNRLVYWVWKKFP